LRILIILVVGRIIVGILTKVVRRLMVRNKIEETLTKFVVSLTKVALLTFVVIAAIRQLGVETNSFVAIIGAAGLAVGFALQGTLANFAAGVMIIIFKPFKAGDFIEGGGSAGTVEMPSKFSIPSLKAPTTERLSSPTTS
jgi:small conductance mechanosensitive channel